MLVLLPNVALAQGANAAPEPTVLVTTQSLKHGSLPRSVTAYGILEAAPGGGSETLSVLRAGRIMQVEVRQGEAVRRGQVLLSIATDPAALASYKQAVAAMTQARIQRQNTAKMLAQHLATRDQLAAADRAAADARSSLDALDRSGGGSAQQALSAPFDGIVSALLVAPGARVAAQTPLLTIARASRLVAAVGVEPDVQAQLATGQPAQLEPLYAGGVSNGRVVSVSAILDPATRLVAVLIDPAQDNPAAVGLLPGSPVRATVQIGTMAGWLAPRDAVLTDAQGAYVFQLGIGKAVRVDVSIIGMAGTTTVIAGPLDTARPLITGGNYQLQDGAAVRTAAPETTKP